MKRFVARQPILDRDKTLFAYEILFRAGLQNHVQSVLNQPSANVMIDSLLRPLTGGGKAFINVTQDLLVNQQCLVLLPKDRAVVQILEVVEPNERVVCACKSLKEKGYQLLFDDFVHDDRYEPLVKLADFVRVDFQTTPDWIRRNLAQQYPARGIKLLAEKVETPEQFQEALGMGYTYFQGCFFCKPEAIFGRNIPAYKLSYLRLLKEINREDPDLAQIEEILKQEASLTYKLLRYLNSPVFDFAVEVKSIRHALSLMGLQEIRKWTSLVSMTCMAVDKPKELVVSSVLRGKFCENLAAPIGLASRSSELFLLGLISMMDAILERPLSEILRELPVSGEIKAALLNGVNIFRYVYELVLAYERGNWTRASQFASSLRMTESSVTQAYLDAAHWGQQIFQIDAAA